MPPLSQMLQDWHDFYILVGTAAATLVGLMFVTASIGSSFFTKQRLSALSAFLSPTVVHFTAILLTCLLAVIPTQTWYSLGAMLAATGLLGSVYCWKIVVQFIVRHSFNVDAIDRLFYALTPALGHLMLLISAVLLFMRSPAAPDLIAAALLTLLLAGIRNAWDMTVWIVISVPSDLPSPPPPPPSQ